MQLTDSGAVVHVHPGPEAPQNVCPGGATAPTVTTWVLSWVPTLQTVAWYVELEPISARADVTVTVRSTRWPAEDPPAG